MISILRMSRRPVFDTRPSRPSPPLECCLGVSPSVTPQACLQHGAAKSRPFGKIFIGGGLVVIAATPVESTPGPGPTSRIVGARTSAQLDIQARDLLVQVGDPVQKQPRQVARRRRQGAVVAVDDRGEAADMGGADGRDDALLGQMRRSRRQACLRLAPESVPPAHAGRRASGTTPEGVPLARRIDRPRALPDQKIAGAIPHRSCLLSLALHRRKPHGRMGRRLCDRLCIGHVVLLTRHERLGAGQCDRSDLVVEIVYRPTPRMGARAGLHRRDAGRLIAQGLQQLRVRRLAPGCNGPRPLRRRALGARSWPDPS
jgi:hypothetical protein